MYTSILVVALAGILPSLVEQSPSWLTDYQAARNKGRAEKKPLAVFIGSGKAGWNQLAQERLLGKEASRILVSDYVCAYIDTSGAAGKALAKAFEVSDGPGLIISDRTGDVQAFWHEGELAQDALVRQLQRYAEPDRLVRTTETVNSQRRSFYPPVEAPPVVPYYNPAPVFFPSFMGGGGRGC
jgi:hypothetical protein